MVESRPVYSKRYQMDLLPLELQTSFAEIIEENSPQDLVDYIEYQFVNVWFIPDEPQKWGVQLIAITDPFIRTTWRLVKWWQPATGQPILIPTTDCKSWGELSGPIYNSLLAIYEQVVNEHDQHMPAAKRMEDGPQRTARNITSSLGTPNRRSKIGMDESPAQKRCPELVPEMGNEGTKSSRRVGKSPGKTTKRGEHTTSKIETE